MDIARPQIETRMAQYAEEQLSFNLLALCKSPLPKLAHDMAVSIRSIELINEQMQSHPEWAAAGQSDHDESAVYSRDDPRLVQPGYPFLSITPADVAAADPPNSIKQQFARPDLDVANALRLRKVEVEGQAHVWQGYAAELSAVLDDYAKVRRRRTDHTPAIHTWVKKLAEHNVLEELIQSTN